LRQSFHESEKPNFDEFLLDEGLVDKDDLLPALAQMYQVPAFDAVGYLFDHQLVRMFPKEFLIQHEIIPIERDENMLFFVASNPADEELLPAIGEHVSISRYRYSVVTAYVRVIPVRCTSITYIYLAGAIEVAYLYKSHACYIDNAT